MKRFIIYKITNPAEGVYVGCTSDFDKRIAKYKLPHNKTTLGQRLLSSSLNEFGFDSHKIEIIDQCVCSSAEAQSLEMFWIRSYMANNSKWPEMNGLNLTDGGGGTLGSKRSDLVCEKMSKSCKNKKQVIQLDWRGNIIAEHDSIQAAANYINGSRTAVHGVVYGIREYYKGFKFKFK